MKSALATSNSEAAFEIDERVRASPSSGSFTIRAIYRAHNQFRARRKSDKEGNLFARATTCPNNPAALLFYAARDADALRWTLCSKPHAQGEGGAK